MRFQVLRVTLSLDLSVRLSLSLLPSPHLWSEVDAFSCDFFQIHPLYFLIYHSSFTVANSLLFGKTLKCPIVGLHAALLSGAGGEAVEHPDTQSHNLSWALDSNVIVVRIVAFTLGVSAHMPTICVYKFCKVWFHMPGGKPMLRDRLAELDIKITELADYLNLSRPTLYKYIKAFDESNVSQIPKSVLALFRYIDENPLIDKMNVIGYIIKERTRPASSSGSGANKMSLVTLLKKYCANHPNDEKAQNLLALAQTERFDHILEYLVKVNQSSPACADTDVEDSDNKLLQSFQEMQDIVAKFSKEEK